MDPNGHINNVAYLAWALEVIPDHIWQSYQLTEVSTTTQALGWRMFHRQLLLPAVVGASS